MEKAVNEPIFEEGQEIQPTQRSGKIIKVSRFRMGRTKKKAEWRYRYMVLWSDGIVSTESERTIEAMEHGDN